VVSDDIQSVMSPGSYGWGGFWGTSYWIDPKENLVGLLFLQQMPLSRGDIHNKFKKLVYGALKED
jgi:CubicO group peptidase (beta-lactamase class C family)